MKAIDFPMRFQGGSLVVTDSYPAIVRAQVIDTVMTNFRERIMRPDYGSDAQSLMFHQIDKLRRDDTASLLRARLEYAVPRAEFEDVSLSHDPRGESILLISITYRVNSYSDPTTVSIPFPVSQES